MLIALYGQSRAGKDETARILQEQHGYEWRSFAANLREILLRIDPQIDWHNSKPFRYSEAIKHLGLDRTKEHYPESVELMIRLGQAVRDILGENSWVDAVLPWVSDPSIHFPENLVISDCRQPNEYERIKHYGGQIWKIIRPGTVARGMDNLLDTYQFDLVIHNSGSLDDLAVIVRTAIKKCE